MGHFRKRLQESNRSNEDSAVDFGPWHFGLLWQPLVWLPFHCGTFHCGPGSGPESIGGNVGYRGLQDTGLAGASEGIMSNVADISTQGAQILTDIIKQILANVLSQGGSSPSRDSPQGRR